MLSYIWIGMMAAAVAMGICTGRLAEVGGAAMAGAQDAVELIFSLAGPMLLWSGAAELMRRGGVLSALSRAVWRPISGILRLPAVEHELRENICLNVSANILGLGNAATPPGLAAAKALGSRKGDSLERFIILNTASLQLIPTTVAALRAGLGAESPYDICPAVWITSAAALAVAMFCAVLCGRGKK